ncbi:MAG: hypothetical protein JO081_14290 [Alphaproteobacteria bacterium]|nr:hypothetical protein [Alphaproteobacteria bacterium]
MSVLTRNSWLRHLAVLLIAIVGLGAMTLPSTPAQARVYVGIGIPFPGVGYYAPAPYYPYGYYGYPAYGYYPGGFYIGGAFGPHHHRYYHHWR